MTKTVKAIMDQKTRKLNSIKKLFNNILYSLGKIYFLYDILLCWKIIYVLNRHRKLYSIICINIQPSNQLKIYKISSVIRDYNIPTQVFHLNYTQVSNYVVV